MMNVNVHVPSSSVTITTTTRGPRERAPRYDGDAVAGYATSRSFWASASDCSFFSDWFSI
jgi:hypothetical protein